MSPTGPSTVLFILAIFYLTDFAHSDDLFQGNQTTKVLSNATICSFPSFLKIALGVACSGKTIKNDEHLWFTPAAQPVSIARGLNESCPAGRYQWDSSNSSLCCLELDCPRGQFLAKDNRNTPEGECPKCRNVIFEYICDPNNDSCNSLHVGSKCRKFFNSSDLFICACDAQHGFTQNRLAFPAACTKTIGAVCFFQEHCKFVDPNSRCDMNTEVKPPRGTCKCREGLKENEDGRCEEKIRQIEKIRKVRQIAVADWGDKNIWAEGPLEKYPNYDFSPLSRKSAMTSPVLQQAVNPDSNSGFPTQRFIRAVSNVTTPAISAVNSSGSAQSIPKPQPYMIAAQQMVPNNSSVKQIKTVGGSVTSQQSPVDVKVQLTSSNAVSGTKFSSDDGDTQVDNVLNIILPKRKLQTERPTTSITWDVTHPPSTSSNLQANSKAPYWLKNSSPGPIQSSLNAVIPKQEMQSTLGTTTHPVDSTAVPHESFQTAARFTQKPSVAATTTTLTIKASSAPLEGFHIGAGLVDDTNSAEITAPSTSHSIMISTLPSSSTTSTTKSTTGSTGTTTLATPKVETTSSTTTPSSSSTTTTTTTTSTTTRATVPTTAQLTTKGTIEHQSITTVVASTVLPLGDTEDTVVVDNADGVIKVQLSDVPRRFGGVVRVPAHSVIGGVGRPAQSQEAVVNNVKSEVILPAKVLVSEDNRKSTTNSKPTEPTSTQKPTTTPEALFEHHGVDLSFLQDQTLSKAQMQQKLLQALLELSATTTTVPTTRTTTTTTTTTTTKPALDLSFLSDSTLSAADIQMKLLPLLMQLNSQLTTSLPETSTVVITESPAPLTMQSANSAAIPSDLATALAQLRQLQAAEKGTTAKLNGRRMRLTTTPATTSTTDEFYDLDISTVRPTKKRTISFFGALLNGFGSISPHRQRNQTVIAADQDNQIDSPTTTPTTKATRTNPTTVKKITGKSRPKGQLSDMDDLVDASGLPVPSFTQVFSGLGGLLGGILGSKPSRQGSVDNMNPESFPTGQRPQSAASLKTNNGKIDMSDPKTQMQVAKLMQQAGQLSGTSASQSYASYSKQQSQSGNSKFNFDSPNDQVQFVKFLQTFDKYQPQGQSQSKGANSLFPQPPPMRATATTPVTQPPTAPPAPSNDDQWDTPVQQNPRPVAPSSSNGISLPVDSLSPETWNLIKQMQKPGYYNVSSEQMAALQPILDQMKAHDMSASVGSRPNAQPPPPPPPPQMPQQFPQKYGPPPQQPNTGSLFGGDPYTPFGSVPPVPPLLPQPLPTDRPEPPTTMAPPVTTTTTTTTTTPTTPVPVTVPTGEAKMLFPILEGNIQLPQTAPVVKTPNQPPFSAVSQQHDCPSNCKQDDPNSFCDTRIGACMCKPGYHSSFLEGNVCTKTILSLCSGDEDCHSGGDMNTECAFNGLNRFCTCSNGYLPDNEGTCHPMFAERCNGICSVPNAICDQFKSICRCPTGYAWFKDPWTGQPVCRATLGGAVPCRSDQDLCPIYTPRGKCRNNAFCGCDEGYIPDSWFTNQSERTSCIDVLSAKCDDNSDCTVADRNTMCDRRLRMCACKAGYKPDPFHNSACIAAS